MGKPDQANSELLQEASSINTSAERLHDLFRADPSLARVIASNPSVSVQLLDCLALQFPQEVLDNPLLQFLALEKGGAYREFSLPGLISLCLVCKPKQHADLLEEIRQRFRTGFAELALQEEASLSVEWVHQSIFTLHPTDCDQLIKHPMDFRVENSALAEGRGPVSIHGIPNLDLADRRSNVLKRKEPIRFLQALRNKKLDTFIDDSQITPEDSGGCDFKLELITNSSDIVLQGNSLYRGDDLLFEFSYLIGGDNPIFENGCLLVPVGDVEEGHRRYDINLGEFSDLIGLELKPNGPITCDWVSALAALMIPSAGDKQ